MNWEELKKQVVTEYDRRQLKSEVRYRALDKVEKFLLQYIPQVKDDMEILRSHDRQKLKNDYAHYKQAKINGAESSVINEIYKQMQ